MNRVCQSLAHLDLKVTSVSLEERENVVNKEVEVSMEYRDFPDILVKKEILVNQGEHVHSINVKIYKL